MRTLVVALVLAVAGCGGDDGEPDRGTLPVAVDVPVTILGELDVSVEEGPVGADDISEVSFGSIETPDGPVLIEIWADVVRASGLTRDELVAGGRFRVELTGPSEFSTPELPSYVVGSLVPER
jgi:hypothetical protein